jgi:hypothetical protein
MDACRPRTPAHQARKEMILRGSSCVYDSAATYQHTRFPEAGAQSRAKWGWISFSRGGKNAGTTGTVKCTEATCGATHTVYLYEGCVLD